MSAMVFSPTSFLALRSRRMRAGLAHADPAFRARHAETILSFQRENAGFAGRRGAADLYYTGFTVRALDALCAMEQDVASEINIYMKGQTPDSIIDQLSLLNGFLLVGEARPDMEDAFRWIERFRADDGGYAKTADGKSGSTYHTFLAVLSYDLFGRRPPDIERLRSFLNDRRRSDGGFCDSAPAKRSNTNATAAGISTTMLLDLGQKMTREAKDYLLSMRHETGGWIASQNAPVPDLLSTYTALLTLDAAGVPECDMLVAALCFAKSCEAKTGGFMAGPWDCEVDVEYTYYGLGVVSLAIEKGLEA